MLLPDDCFPCSNRSQDAPWIRSVIDEPDQKPPEPKPNHPNKLFKCFHIRIDKKRRNLIQPA
jgi:hypothetical protein